MLLLGGLLSVNWLSDQRFSRAEALPAVNTQGGNEKQ